MSIENIFPNKEQFDVMNALLASIAQNAGGLKIEKYTDIQQLVRLGVASKSISIGDQLEVNKATSITAAVGTGSVITSATVAFQTFLHKLGTCPAGVYVFTRVSGAWYLLGKPVELSQYGITTAGTETDGDVINVTVEGSVLTFDVAGMDYDVPAVGEHTHTLSLLLHDCFATVAFDAPEALFYVAATDYPSGLPAGTYNITLNHGAYGNGTEQDGTYEFTTTQVVPVGGKIRHSTMGAYQSGSYTHAQITGGKFATYNASNAVIESNLACTEPDTPAGTSLGTATGNSATYHTSENLNYTERNAYGSNNWKESAIRQWLNSAAESGWWSAQTNFDMPQTSPTAGFLYGIDPDFLAVLGSVRKRTAMNTVSDGGGYKDTDEFIFLPSSTELNCGQNNSVYETPVSGTTPKTTPYPLYTGAVNADRVKYLSGATRTWWMRSPDTRSASKASRVGLDGSVPSSILACNALGAVPACCII